MSVSDNSFFDITKSILIERYQDEIGHEEDKDYNELVR